jgi:hypothetical protein
MAKNGKVATVPATTAPGQFVEDIHGQGGEVIESVGGVATVVVAAGAGAAQVQLKKGGGRLCRVLITTTGAGVLTFYDNADGSTSGTVIGIVPANTLAGVILDFQMPAAAGITAGKATGSPACTVSYT